VSRSLRVSVFAHVLFLAEDLAARILEEEPEFAMIEDTIGKIEARIQNAESVKEERRKELLELLGTLKSEVSELSKTHSDEAQSIAGFTAVSAHEATRSKRDPKLLRLSLEGLGSSVAGFEGSHPRLVHIVNAISNTLANLGI
jgi:hypothetical protein